MTTKTPRLARTLRLASPLTAALGLAAAIAFAPAAQAQTYTFSTLATFTGTANGAYPYASVTLDSSGNLYGTTESGGANGDGTVFKIAAGTNTVTTLATFTGAANGANPIGGITLDSSGNLYGTTETGGASNDGTVFKVAAGTNTLSTLATFTGTANGQDPFSGVTLDSSGNLYGTTYYGGANNEGVVFKVAAGTNALSTVAAFNNTKGENPQGGVVFDSSGNLYGTTSAGGSTTNGTVFKIAAGTSTVTTLVTFTGNANGANPTAGLAIDSGGNLYGTAYGGGASSDGTVFKVAAGTNVLTILATFNGANGATPIAGVTLDSSGNLYGATVNGGASSDGTVFKITSGTNLLTTLVTFNGTNGENPGHAAPIVDSSGNIYGTTLYGGLNNDGTVFKLTASGAAPEPGALALLLPFGVPAAFGLERRRKHGLRMNLKAQR